MSKTPTKAQRHAIYKKALKDIDDGGGIFLCASIFWMGGNKFVSDADDVKDVFPELLSQKPKRSGYCWWPTRGKGPAKRREALLRCIELSKPAKP